MGLLQRVARARLASRVIRRLRSAGVSDAGYDAATFSVRFRPVGRASPAVMHLDNLLAELGGRRRERRAQIARFVDGFARVPEVPTEWQHVCPRLRPVLRGATPASGGEAMSTPLRRPVLPFLAEFVVVDQPDTMTYVSVDQLAGWGVTADEVFASARTHLSVSVQPPAGQAPVVLRFVDDGDAYWTSHLLLDGWLAGLAGAVGGTPVAFAPERGTLLVTADGTEQLPALFALAEETYVGSPRGITPMAYVSGPDGRTTAYPALPGHPLHRVVQRAGALLAVHEYAHQTRLLAGGPAVAAPLQLVGSPEDGWRTRAVWAADGPALLPEADEVLFGTTVMPWTEIVPALTRVDHVDPPRWHATRWPA